VRLIAASLCLWLVAGMAAAAELSSEDTRELEGLLVRLGFDPGPVDGIADAQTSAAIEGYQSFAALRVDGVASSALLEELRGVTESLGTDAGSAPSEATPPSATAVTAAVTAAETATDDGSGTASQSGGSAAPPPAGLVTGAPWDTAIHLASFKQESKAHEEWRRLQGRLPDLLGDMDSMISAFDLGDEGLYFRLYAGPFPNLATAQDFCVTVSQEGYRCVVARGDTMQVAATSPAAPEVPDGSEAVAVTEEPPSEPLVSEESGETIATPDATPDASVGSDASELSPAIEEAIALEPPDATESAVTEADATEEEMAAAQVPEDDVESVPPAQALAEPTEEEEAGTVMAAPSIPVTTEQIGAATPDEAPEDVTEDAAEDAAEEGPSETVVGAPTLLIAAAQFGEAAPSTIPGETAEIGPSETAIGAPTLLVTAFDFGDEDANAEPGPETEGSADVQPETDRPADVETAAPASSAGETTESDNTEIEITATDDVTAEAAEAGEAGEAAEAAETAEAVPADETEPEATQSAALVATGTEDYATATAAFKIGDCPTALRYYEQAFEKGGLPRRDLAAGYNNRGRCHYDSARYDEALADLDRAIGLDREFAAAYYNRGRAHNAMGNSSEARADLKSAYDLGFGRLQPLQ